MKPTLLDTGAIVALLDRSERKHEACVAALGEVAGPLVTCEAVIAESCYLVRKMRGAAAAILENIATGAFQVPFQIARSAPQLQRILAKYRDREIDLADACLIHLANEIGSGDILTLDRDFDVYRWGANKPFRRLIPLDPSH